MRPSCSQAPAGRVLLTTHSALHDAERAGRHPGRVTLLPRVPDEPFLNATRIGHHELDVVWLLIAVQQSLPVVDRRLLAPDRSA